jgi:hypothetical protein
VINWPQREDVPALPVEVPRKKEEKHG